MLRILHPWRVQVCWCWKRNGKLFFFFEIFVLPILIVGLFSLPQDCCKSIPYLSVDLLLWEILFKIAITQFTLRGPWLIRMNVPLLVQEMPRKCVVPLVGSTFPRGKWLNIRPRIIQRPNPSLSPISNLTSTITSHSNHTKHVVLPAVLTVSGVVLIAICLGVWLRRKRLQLQQELAVNGSPMEVSLHAFRHSSPEIHSFVS